MKLVVYDYAGHPFQAQLSRELAARGHDVVHVTCDGYVSGKGRLSGSADAPAGEPRYASIGANMLDKSNLVLRALREFQYGVELAGLLRRERPTLVMSANASIPTLVVMVLYLWLRRIPWVLWHQDVHALAVGKIAAERRSPLYKLAAKVITAGEVWTTRRAAHVVVIADSFVDVHRGWGTADKVTVIPNWAPLDEIVLRPRHNDWSAEQGLDDRPTLVYSGTLGHKHTPELLPRLAARVRDLGADVDLVVVNSGPAEPVVRAEAEKLGVPLTYLPFQPYDRLPEVLATGDVLVVILEKSAGAFSVPSKTLSYLCAGRPVLGLMPEENLASVLLERAGCAVFPPDDASIDAAAKWVVEVLQDATLARRLAVDTRALAEAEFNLADSVAAFERIVLAHTR